MKILDRFLQYWRICKAKKYISKDATVLDVGCADARLYDVISGIEHYVGIDSCVDSQDHEEKFQLIKGAFPKDLPIVECKFDSLIMLAILEHIPESAYPSMAQRCFDVLKPGGKVVITVPEPLVDTILHVLRRLNLIDGMELEQHHAVDTKKVPIIFTQVGFRHYHSSKFQLGLNNLFVFERPS